MQNGLYCITCFVPQRIIYLPLKQILNEFLGGRNSVVIAFVAPVPACSLVPCRYSVDIDLKISE